MIEKNRIGWLLCAYAHLLLLSACTIFDPISRAETTEQKAWALYGTFVVFQEQAAKLVVSPEVSESVKERIRSLDRAAHPLSQNLFDASQTAITARRAFENGTGSQEEVEAALLAIARIYFEVKPALEEFITAVEEQ